MDLNYMLEGSGETLVFIHGLSDNLLYWQYLTSNLKINYQILRIDLRGHGESELGQDEITVDTYVNDLNELLNELNIQKVNIIGFSLGGAVALDFTIKYPELVSSLVLMSSFSKADDYLKNIFSQFKGALENSFEDFYDLILPMVLCPDVINSNREELDVIKREASQNANVEAYIKAIGAGSDFNAEKELSDVNVPVLILAGKYDQITSLNSQIALNNNLKNSELVIFNNARHNLLIGKNNVKISNILKDFYKKRKDK